MSSLTITPAYRELNSQLHQASEGYGSQGWMWLGPVLTLAQTYGATSLLDYGCGKDSLARWAPELSPPMRLESYDPAITEHSADPPICDFVACLDVMEHIEPKLLPNVLAHIRGKMRKAGFMVISLRKANKALPDGRNAHLIVQPADWWMAQLQSVFSNVRVIQGLTKDGLVVVVEA